LRDEVFQEFQNMRCCFRRWISCLCLFVTLIIFYQSSSSTKKISQNLSLFQVKFFIQKLVLAIKLNHYRKSSIKMQPIESYRHRISTILVEYI